VVLDAAIGSHDADQTRPLQRDTVFSIFSITPMTAWWSSTN